MNRGSAAQSNPSRAKTSSAVTGRSITGRAAVLAATAALTLTGCGLGSTVVGAKQPPAEVTTVAPISETSAQDIALRVLDDAQKASTATGESAQALRDRALSGSALTMANAESKIAKTAPPTTDPVVKPSEPKVLAISRGQQWPRFLLVQSSLEDGSPVLNYLSSPDAKTPFRLSASAPMQPGASVAALDTLQQGSQLAKDGTGLAGDPATLLSAYADSLAYPKPKKATASFAGDDRFATSVRQNAAAQAKALGALATFTQTHKPVSGQTVAVALRDGGAVVFALMERGDTIELKPGGKTLTPSPEFQKLIKKRTLTEKAELKTYESVVFTIPTSGASRLVAVDEVLVSAEGT